MTDKCKKLPFPGLLKMQFGAKNVVENAVVEESIIKRALCFVTSSKIIFAVSNV